jgi:hypothetical protein
MTKAQALSIMQDVKETIRKPFAWPGGYPRYVVLSDGEMLCRICARENFRAILRSTVYDYHDGGWRAAGASVLWEGFETCAQCNKALPSAYGTEDCERTQP